MTQPRAQIVDLPKVSDPRGNLTFLEGSHHVPFEIRRVYYLYDVPGGELRGSHAHKECEEFIIAVSGSFDIVLDNGCMTNRYSMRRSYYGLYVPRMVWRTLDNFSSGSVCLVLSSHPYEEADYIRDYDRFLLAIKSTPIAELG